MVNQSRRKDDHVDSLSQEVVWNKAANGYRLPTEAEWEYCARAGQDTIYSGSDELDDVAWYKENSGGKTHPVGQKKGNAFGLYDMSGNVWEWIWDTWKKDAYRRGERIDPIISHPSPYRVLRGGSEGHRRLTRVSNRNGVEASSRYGDLGFRFLRMPL